MGEVNYLAVIAATFIAAALGALWYSPVLFAEAWMKANGHTPEKMEAMKNVRSPAVAVAVSVVCNLAIAFVIALLSVWIGIAGWMEGLGLGLLIWAGFAAPLALSANMFSGKPLAAFVIDASYQFVYLALMGLVIGFWR